MVFLFNSCCVAVLIKIRIYKSSIRYTVLSCFKGGWYILPLILLGTESSLMLIVGQTSVNLTVNIQNQIKISDTLYASCALFAVCTLCEAD